jgi:hypothetical protein
MKILHLPTTVGGNPQRLSMAERRMALDSSTLTFRQNLFQYPADEVLFKGKNFIRNEIKRWWLILISLRKYDVIHFNFGLSAAPYVKNDEIGQSSRWKSKLYNTLYANPLECFDLRVLRRWGKVIAVTYQGDDARQGDFCKQNYHINHAHEVESGYFSPISDQQKRKRITLFDKYADFIYALNPDLLNMLPERAEFLPYASVDLDEWSPIGVNDNLQCPHIVHAPSDRLIKGTKYLEHALERLKKEGLRFKYTIVEGMSNHEAKKVYESADLLVDQLLVGWYGALAVELMALGKPVVCYVRESDLTHISKEMQQELPIIHATPDSIYKVIKELLTVRKPELNAIGERSRKFVQKWHDPNVIALKTKRDYETALGQHQPAYSLSENK